MERESEWKKTNGEEEEVEEEVAEELGGGLEIRQRKRGKMGRGSEEQEVNEEERSIYFHADRGAEDDAISGLKLREVDQFVARKNLGNGKANIKTKEFNNYDNIRVEEENQSLKDAAAENGSNSHLTYGKNSENGITRNEEIEECEQFRPVKSSKLEFAEFDVERVLDEQETHDLFCPNCHSCITKRVILRKRKRIFRESQHDLPPEKLQHVHEASSAPHEMAELGHEDETVFRCLSCFSFFIPTESGFNIFRIFGKREQSQSLQSSEQIPARNVNWVHSIFRSDGSKKKGTGAGLPLQTESNTIPEKQMGGPFLNIQDSPATITPGAANSEGVLFPVESNTISSEDPSFEAMESSPAITILGAAELGQNGTTIGMNDSGEGPFFEVSQSSPSPTLSGATKFEEKPSPGESYSIGNRLMGNQAQGDMQGYPAIIVLEGDGINKPIAIFKPQLHEGISQSNVNINSSRPQAAGILPPDTGNDIIDFVSMMVKPTSLIGTTQSNQNTHGSVPDAAVETHVDVGVQGEVESGRNNDWDVLKSIVYGGLIESITSLGVVSSAAGADSSTLNICALGLASLIGGLFVIAHNLSELRSSQDPEATNQMDKPAGRYWELLGKREHFRRHVVFSILSYIIFGLLPPVIYGFAFRESDNKEYKIIAMAAASLMCITLLAIGKAHVKPQKDYIKCLLYYLGLGVSASGLSYVAGVMIHKLLVELGLFDQSAASPSPPSSIEFLGTGSGVPAWTSI